jgi:hypothetical protein
MMSDVTLGFAQYRTQVEGLGIDCAWITGCIPLLNNNAEEHSWFRNVNFYNPGGTEYARVTQVATAGPQSGAAVGGGAANSGPYLDFGGNLLGEVCELSSCGGVGTGDPVNEGTGVGGSVGNGIPVNPLNCETLGLLFDGPQNQSSTPFYPQNVLKDIGSFTLTVNDPAQNGNTPKAMAVGSGSACGAVYTSGYTPIGVIAYGVSTHVHDWHSEYFAAEAEIGGYQALNAAFLGATNALTLTNDTAAQLATTFGVTMNNLSSFGAGGNSYQFDIGPYNVSDIDIFGVSRFGTQTNLVRDNITGNRCNNASDLAESFYMLGHGTSPTVVSSCIGTNNQFAGPFTVPFAGAASQAGLTVSGAPYTGGTGTTNFPQLYVNTSGSTGPSTFSTSGTMFGINAPSGFSGNLVDTFVNGSGKFTVQAAGGAIAQRLSVDKGTTLVAGSFTLSASWGTIASTSITVSTSKDQANVSTITAGSTPAANPTYTLTFTDGTWVNTPVCVAAQTGGNGATSAINPLVVSARSATAYTWIWTGTPVSGKTYEITISCMGT